MGNSDHNVVSISIDFPSNSKWDAPFHWIAYGYSRAHWIFVIVWEIFHWKISLSLVLLLLLVNFGSGFKLELMYVSLIVSIRSSLTNLHCFQVVVLLPQFIEITFFVCTNRINLLNLKESSDRLVIVPKGFLKLPNLHVLIKQKSFTSQKLGSWDFWLIANSVFSKGKFVIPLLFNGLEVLSSAFDKAKIFAKNSSKNSNLDDSGISLPVYSLPLYYSRL